MTDTTMRSLERRATQTTTGEDEARVLTAWVRAGRLVPRRLELAAYIGHGAALVAVGRKETPVDLRAWAFGLDGFGLEACLRAGLADVGRCVGLLDRAIEGAGRGCPADVREAVALHERIAQTRADVLASWVLLPSRAGRDAIEATLSAEPDLPPVDRESFDRAGLDGEAVVAAATQALLATRTLTEHALGGRPFSVGEWWPTEISGTTARRVRSAIGRAVAPWALGQGDPLLAAGQGTLDRVELASPCDESWEGNRRAHALVQTVRATRA